MPPISPIACRHKEGHRVRRQSVLIYYSQNYQKCAFIQVVMGNEYRISYTSVTEIPNIYESISIRIGRSRGIKFYTKWILRFHRVKKGRHGRVVWGRYFEYKCAICKGAGG